MANKARVPKCIAGVKLPKSLRRGLKDLAAQKDGKILIVETFAAANAALAAGRREAASKAGKAGAQRA